MSAIVHGLNIFWHYLSLRLKGKLAFSSSVTTAEISKNASILSAALKQCYLLGFEEISGLSHSIVSLYFFVLISHASKVRLKILQVRLQQYLNKEFPDVQAAFRKGRGTRDQIANIVWITEKAREFQKNIYLCASLTT